MTKTLARVLSRYMKIRHIKTKAEAVRTAIKEGLERSADFVKPVDFSSWIGLGLEAPTNKKPQFKIDDDLWK